MYCFEESILLMFYLLPILVVLTSVLRYSTRLFQLLGRVLVRMTKGKPKKNMARHTATLSAYPADAHTVQVLCLNPVYKVFRLAIENLKELLAKNIATFLAYPVAAYAAWAFCSTSTYKAFWGNNVLGINDNATGVIILFVGISLVIDYTMYVIRQ